MATNQTSKVLQHLRSTVLLQYGAGLTDGQLLDRFIEQRDDVAFAALVKRHGPMVWGVCRRILGRHHDAEDAFQVAFLILFRKARSVRPREMVANWLYGVAYQTALQARRTITRRREKQVMEMPEPEAAQRDHWNDLQPLLDEELSRLPDKYRVVILLCDLETKTRKEAARQLNLPEGTVAGRVARARVMLAKRLARRGLVLSGGALAAVLSQNLAAAGVPTSVVSSTIKVASVLAAGQAVAIIPAQVAALMKGVLKAMLLTKVKSAIAVLLVLGIAALGAGGLISRSLATEPAGGMPDSQEQGQVNPGDLHERVVQLKQQLQQLQKTIARLEQETQPRRNQRNTRNTRDTFLANRFSYRVPFETGYTEFKEGGRIEIHEVWGTRPRIEVGGQYLVRGKYVMPPGERGKLYFYETATGDWSQTTTTLDLQSTAVDKQEGEFTLVHGMAGPGYFHLYLAPAENYSRTFANLYFGTGDTVLRKKP
jgi:RNA polymerase sigma factor (sigma-70 family)